MAEDQSNKASAPPQSGPPAPSRTIAAGPEIVRDTVPISSEFGVQGEPNAPLSCVLTSRRSRPQLS